VKVEERSLDSLKTARCGMTA